MSIPEGTRIITSTRQGTSNSVVTDAGGLGPTLSPPNSDGQKVCLFVEVPHVPM